VRVADVVRPAEPSELERLLTLDVDVPAPVPVIDGVWVTVLMMTWAISVSSTGLTRVVVSVGTGAVLPADAT
jgi:hypothetical protein